MSTVQFSTFTDRKEGSHCIDDGNACRRLGDGSGCCWTRCLHFDRAAPGTSFFPRPHDGLSFVPFRSFRILPLESSAQCAGRVYRTAAVFELRRSSSASYVIGAALGRQRNGNDDCGIRLSAINGPIIPEALPKIARGLRGFPRKRLVLKWR